MSIEEEIEETIKLWYYKRYEELSTAQSVYEFLGWTYEEYCNWIKTAKHPNILGTKPICFY